MSYKRLLLAGSLLVGVAALAIAVRGSSAFHRGLASLTHRSPARFAAEGKARNSEEKYQTAQEIYSSGFKNDWQERGPTKVSGASQADLDLSNYGSWSLRHPTQTGDFDALVLRLKTTHPILDAIEVKLTSDMISLAPVLLMRGHTVVDKDGWTEVTLPWETLNPERRHFDGLRIRAIAPLGVQDVKLDSIALARARSRATLDSNPQIPTREGTVQIDCRSPT
ncbi:MAG TPA: hypothetical protein VKP30_16510, partial [Polyangiaceae bacterium]|nr:hypothetical protein [Polyangiaceae bacterium]